MDTLLATNRIVPDVARDVREFVRRVKAPLVPSLQKKEVKKVRCSHCVKTDALILQSTGMYGSWGRFVSVGLRGRLNVFHTDAYVNL